MPRQELTKQLIADTTKNLALKKQLDKISVSEIVDTAGINRQTFYYHFADKQELICWIFDTDISMLTDKNKNDTLIDDIIEYIYSEKVFYTAALTSEAQNNLREHLYEVCYSRCIDEITSMLGDRKMDEKIIEFLAGFFSNAITGALFQWAQKGMKGDNIKFVENYAPVFKELLILAIDRYSE